MTSSDDTIGNIHKDVAQYYGEKIARHGATANGVDWKDETSQELRFAQLARIIDPETTRSIVDVGCGYGAMLGYLRKIGYRGRYTGTDLAPDMIVAAEQLHGADTNASFLCTSDIPPQHDVIIASGIFNVRLGFAADDWQGYIEKSIRAFAQQAEQGFAFNCLTSYSDKDRQRADLFYADPCHFFDLCKRSFSRNVALLHDYDLYEFTMLVRLPR